MKFALQSLESRLNDVNETELRKTLNGAIAFLLSEGPDGEHTLFDLYTPGNYMMLNNGELKLKYDFTEFKRDSRGILASIGDTSVSWSGGVVNGHKVIFVHPTSNTVNYQDIKDTLKRIADIPLIDSNVYSELRHIIKKQEQG